MWFSSWVSNNESSIDTPHQTATMVKHTSTQCVFETHHDVTFWTPFVKNEMAIYRVSIENNLNTLENSGNSRFAKLFHRDCQNIGPLL